MGTYGDCERTLRRQKIVLEEGKTKVTFGNPRKRTVRHVKVDGCAIKTGVRCDDLLITASGTAYYVELKGSAMGKAVKQLERTVRVLDEGETRFCFAVGHRVAPSFLPTLQRAKVQFKRDLNASLLTKKSGSTDRLDT